MQQREIRQRGGATIRPMPDVMTLAEAACAARETAGPVAIVQRPPQGRRDRPRPRADLRNATIRVVVHHHPRRIAGQASRRLRGNVGRRRSRGNVIQRLAGRIQRLPQHGADLRLEPCADDDHAVFILIQLQRPTRRGAWRSPWPLPSDRPAASRARYARRARRCRPCRRPSRRRQGRRSMPDPQFFDGRLPLLASVSARAARRVVAACRGHGSIVAVNAVKQNSQ